MKDRIPKDTIALLCLPNSNKEYKPNSFYGFTTGKVYLARTSNITESEGEKFIYLKGDSGMKNVRLSRFKKL